LVIQSGEEKNIPMGFPATTRSFPDIPFLRATSFQCPPESRPPHHQDSGHPRENSETAPQERHIGIYQKSQHLIFAEVPMPYSGNRYPGSLLASISSVDGRIGIVASGVDDEIDIGDHDEGDTENTEDTAGTDTFWKTGSAPSWASDWGTDQYGHWVTFTVARDDKPITQRLRWIMPGHFLMGSPPQEAERYDDEGPQYEVTLQTGFWLCDTACTQELWQTVMGTNPSRFKGADLPIEQINWNDVQEFLGKINSEIPGIDLVLPSEAEWEYACRAGTTTPFCFGANITPDEVNYNGDYPYAGGEIGAYRKCTVPVASLPPNLWGLYEMHGNVWEWTRDYWRENYREATASSDRQVETISDVGRVVRGGSWHNVARIVRSAVRGKSKPGDHSNNLGFRCARIGSNDQPANLESAVAEKSKIHAVGYALPYPGIVPSVTPKISPSITTPGEIQVRIRETASREHCPLPAQKEFSIRSDQENLTLRTETKPQWASAIGRDGFGLWTEVSLDVESGNETTPANKTVTQRLRWIPPGRFLMGSPESEWALFSKYDQAKWCIQEGPQHQVILTRGYWLFDTPCTQALWQAVMGDDNPSRFRSPTRPVEFVSWEEINEFLEKINARIPGLDLQLPTEAQWEYACRAGSETATYAGPMETAGANNAPVLDPIAWYGGNSGVAFDLDNGYDSSSSDWKEKQYDHTRAGTHPVGEKQANPWGLYDMLGNVWEWCRDGQRDYGFDTIIDPVGPLEAGVERMVRGGSWYYFARYVRAASRFRYLPGVRLDRLGFRCVAP